VDISVRFNAGEIVEDLVELDKVEFKAPKLSGSNSVSHLISRQVS